MNIASHRPSFPGSVTLRGLCLVLSATLCAASLCATSHAQQAEQSSTASQVVPVTAAVAADAPPARNSLRELPADVLPNQPNPDDLKSANRTWRGEYEADTLGKPLLGPDGRALPVLYDKKGKRLKSVTKVPKTHPIAIVAGTLTVDGWTGKARLNHDIPDLRYIYLSAPGVGTVIVSQAAFVGATEQKAAFNGSTLTVMAADHQMQLASEKPLLGKRVSAAWVKLDPTFTVDPRFPVMGYGSGLTAPYEWPGAKVVAGVVNAAPPLPQGMEPKLVDCSPSKHCAVAKSATQEPSPEQ